MNFDIQLLAEFKKNPEEFVYPTNSKMEIQSLSRSSPKLRENINNTDESTRIKQREISSSEENIKKKNKPRKHKKHLGKKKGKIYKGIDSCDQIEVKRILRNKKINNF